LKVILNTFLQEIGGAEELSKFVTENDIKNWNKTIFDYDLSDPNDPKYKKNLLKSILSFYMPKIYEEIRKTIAKDIESVANNTERIHKLKNFIEHIGVVFKNHSIHLGNRVKLHNRFVEHMTDEMFLHEFTAVGKAERNYEDIHLHPFSPLMNYSCFPNVEKVSADNRLVHIVVRPIKAGEELLRSPL
jgi:hypothetical protein